MFEHMDVFFTSKAQNQRLNNTLGCKKICDHYLAFQKHLEFEFLFSLLWKAISFLLTFTSR